MIELAQHFISGKLSDDLLLNGSDDDVARALIAVRGIGRWTVDMFLIFTLRRPDVLPVGDLGVQKGLLRWVLAAHGALPPSVPKTPKKGKKDHEPSDYGASEQPETVKTPPPKSEGYVLVTPQKLPPGALHPNGTTLATPVLSSTPAAPAATPNPKTDSKLPPAAPDSILHTPHGWDSAAAHRAAPLPEGLSLSALKARLAGKKAK